MYICSTREESAGPPWVVTEMVSNTWKLPMIVMISTSARIGRSSGSVIRRNSVISPAPSVRAAS